MLDEFREYKEYTCDIDDEKPIRFDTRTFLHNNELRGLSRALKIIARKELQDRGYFEQECNDREKIIEEVKNVLIRWTGFSDGLNDSCLKQYYSYLLKKYYDEYKPDEEISQEEIQKKKTKQYRVKVFDDSSNTGKNNYKMTTFDNSVADAIAEGPLHRYYLVCRKGADKLLNNNGRMLDPSQKKNGEQIDAIFKLIALYLIQKRITGNTYNYVNNAELGNWTHKYAITKDDYFKSKGKILKYKDKEISQSIKTLSGNVSKIQICPEYLEAGQFRIVEEKDFNGVEEGFTFYSDQGAGKKLAEKIFYSGT